MTPKVRTFYFDPATTVTQMRDAIVAALDDEGLVYVPVHRERLVAVERGVRMLGRKAVVMIPVDRIHAKEA